MFEVVRSGFDGRVAIDDVAFVNRPCTMPRMCSFEGQRCGYNTFGKIAWVHQSGSTSTTIGPRTDHTLETDTGERKHWRRVAFYCTVQNGEILSSSAGLWHRLLHDG